MGPVSTYTMGTHVSFIFRGYFTHIFFAGVKASFFMVLGSKGIYYYNKTIKL